MNLFLIVVLAASLPTFEDFRRIDRTRRMTGQLQTAELLNVSRIDADLIVRTAQRNAGDARQLWGAAELLVDWPSKRALFEAALLVGGTNAAVATRLACVAAKHGDANVALQWLHH